MKKSNITLFCSIAVFMAVIGFSSLTKAAEVDDLHSWSRILPGDDRFELVLYDDAVLDHETGLVWAKVPFYISSDWWDANELCTTAIIGGRAGWKMPSVTGLASLIDPSSGTDPFLPAGHPFEGFKGGSAQFWTSTNYRKKGYVWTVEFGSGVAPSIASIRKKGSLWVWCVRSS